MLHIIFWRRWHVRWICGNFLTVMAHWAIDAFYFLLFSLFIVSKFGSHIPVHEYHTEIERRYDHSFYSPPLYHCWIQLLLSLKFSGSESNILFFDKWFGVGRNTWMVAGVRVCAAFHWKSHASQGIRATLGAGEDRCQESLWLQPLLDPLEV